MSVFRQIFETLREYYATRPSMPWWPDDPLEVVVGAILVQGSTWKSVSRVLDLLRERRLLDFHSLRSLEEDELAALIRPVGFHLKKAKRLQEVAALFLERSDGDPIRFFARDADTVRREFLEIGGIGPGTADNILLYAGRYPIYMVDPFTRRILIRHEIVSRNVKDGEIQELVHRELTPDEEPYGAKLFGDFQALVVRLGREFCEKTNPACHRCPLFDFLPSDGPIGVGEPAGSRGRAAGRRMTADGLVSPKSSGALPEKEEPKPIEELQLNDAEKKIVELLSTEPTSIDSVIQATNLPVHVVRATIAILEMRKIVRQLEGNNVRRV